MKGCNVVVLGLPGSGKGTQSKLIAKKFPLGIVATGDMLRCVVGDKSVPARYTDSIKKTLSEGRLITDELMNAMVSDYLRTRRHLDKRIKGFIFDGFPRSISQANTLDSLLQESKTKVDLVVNLVAEDEQIIKRLENRIICGQCSAVYNSATCPPAKPNVCDICEASTLISRADDDQEVVRKRIKALKPVSSDLIRYYDGRTEILHVDALAPVSSVFDSISEVLERICIARA